MKVLRKSKLMRVKCSDYFKDCLVYILLQLSLFSNWYKIQYNFQYKY